MACIARFLLADSLWLMPQRGGACCMRLFQRMKALTEGKMLFKNKHDGIFGLAIALRILLVDRKRKFAAVAQLNKIVI